MIYSFTVAACFTDLNPSGLKKFHAGFVYLAIIAFIVVFYMLLIVYGSIKNCKRIRHQAKKAAGKESCLSKMLTKCKKALEERRAEQAQLPPEKFGALLRTRRTAYDPFDSDQGEIKNGGGPGRE